ncbi:MAG TPA: carboxylating nicotinate-nucleotide diphosphorylase [Nitrososphaeraceae archaeon]
MYSFNSFLDIRKTIINFLEEDVGTGDITSNSIVPPDITMQAAIVCNSLKESVVCGLEEASIVFDICKCKYKIIIKDGSRVKRGNIVMKITGKARSILKAERTALNLIMRMSGIATTTRKFVDHAEKYDHLVNIAGTRKTAPGLRFFDKKAVTVGGGHSHRFRLDDMVLIKNNHLSLTSSIERSIQLAKAKVGSSMKVECEVKNMHEAMEAINAGANIIMLDNFSPSEVAETIKIITEIGVRNNVQIEVSGGINLNNLRDYVEAKPDIISVGYLTHSSQAVDYSLQVVKTI